MDSVPDDYFGKKQLFLNDGCTITLEEGETGIRISMHDTHGNEIPGEYSMRYPEYGYGEGGLTLSPLESYLLFYYFSAQGEEEFKLFEIPSAKPGFELVLIHESGLLEGRYAEFCFFDDDKRLLTCMLHEFFECWQKRGGRGGGLLHPGRN